MSKPFAYLSATRNEWKEPLVVKADKPLELRYAVALWDGEVDKATVEKLYQRWLQFSSDQTDKYGDPAVNQKQTISSKPASRRDFLRMTAATAATAAVFQPKFTIAADTAKGANERIGVGFIGTGGRAKPISRSSTI